MGGRVLSYEVAPPSERWEGQDSYETRELMELMIDQVFFGSINSSVVSVSRTVWVGEVPGGSCGILAQNMQDDYIIVGLHEREGETYSLPEVPPLFAGAEPSGELYEGALQYLGLSGDTVLPATGTGPAPSPRTNHLLFAIAAAGVALLATAGALRYRPRRKT